MRYIFSGSGTGKEVIEILARDTDFKPISCLCTYLEKSSFKHLKQYKEEELCDFIMIDSAAYGVFTGTGKANIDDYIDFINQNHEYCDIFAELDVIPGKFGKPRNLEDFKESAEKSWENFLYIRERICCPEKLIPIYHNGESLSALMHMLNWRDDKGNLLDYIGISPMTDSTTSEKTIFLSDVFETVKNSDNPNVKIHLFGVTSFFVLEKFPCESFDSTSYIRTAAYGSIMSPTFGTITISSKNTKIGKGNGNFLLTADEKSIEKLKEELTPLGLTLKDISENPNARAAFNMWAGIKRTESLRDKTNSSVKKKRLI